MLVQCHIVAPPFISCPLAIANQSLTRLNPQSTLAGSTLSHQMAAPWPRCQHIQNGMSHPSSTQLGTQKNNDNNTKTIFLCSCLTYNWGDFNPLSNSSHSAQSSKGFSTLDLKCHEVSPTISSSEAQILAQSLQRRPVGSSRVAVLLSCFSPGLDAGRRVGIEIWMVQPFPLFSAKFNSLFSCVTRYAQRYKNWTIAISTACDGLKFLAQCPLIPRASAQWLSSSVHVCCPYSAHESHLPPHFQHHAGLNLSAFPWLREKVWSNAMAMGGRRMALWTRCFLSFLLPSMPHLLLGLTSGGSKFLSSSTLKPWWGTHLGPHPKRAHQVIPSNKFCDFP